MFDDTGRAIGNLGGSIANDFKSDFAGVVHAGNDVASAVGHVAGDVTGAVKAEFSEGLQTMGAFGQVATGLGKDAVVDPAVAMYNKGMDGLANAVADRMPQGGPGMTGTPLKLDYAKAGAAADELRGVSKKMVSIAEQFQAIITRLLAAGLQSDANSGKIKSYASQIKTKSAEKAEKLNRFAKAIDEEVATVRSTETQVGSFDTTVTIQ